MLHSSVGYFVYDSVTPRARAYTRVSAILRTVNKFSSIISISLRICLRTSAPLHLIRQSPTSSSTMTSPTRLSATRCVTGRINGANRSRRWRHSLLDYRAPNRTTKRIRRRTSNHGVFFYRQFVFTRRSLSTWTSRRLRYNRYPKRPEHFGQRRKYRVVLVGW